MLRVDLRACLLPAREQKTAVPDTKTPAPDSTTSVHAAKRASRPRRLTGALAVAAGIFLSRVAGLLRERAIAHFLGVSAAADAFRAALRIPNLLQNLLGEGVLSASFIPVYARLLAEGKAEEAGRVARAVATLLALCSGLLALFGVLFAEQLVALLAPGFKAATLSLTVELVRILFPGVALLVMAAFCLGVLNSHRRFFLSYASPVLWNAALIVAVVVAGLQQGSDDHSIAVWLAFGAVGGSLAQLLVQIPSVVRLLGSVRPVLTLQEPGVRRTMRAFFPVLLGRGSVQISGYIDQILASYMGEGIVAALSNAQTLYLLPVSLFGMAVSAAELPEMSGALGDDRARAVHLQSRLRPALRRVVFMVVPSAIAFVTIGDSIVGLLFQGGRFDAAATHAVWLLLAGSAIGLSAGTQGRLLASALYALEDPRAPLRASVVRVLLTAVAGYLVTFPLAQRTGYEAMLPPVLLTTSAGLAAWVEFFLLRSKLSAKIGRVPVPTRLGLGALLVALVAGGAARLAFQGLSALGVPSLVGMLSCVASFGLVYAGGMWTFKVPEARMLVGRVLRRRGT
jgi:putative peptidoglycan lipid II flippase